MNKEEYRLYQREYSREWRNNHREYYNQRQRIYRDKHKHEINRQLRLKYRKLRDDILRKLGNKCVICKKQRKRLYLHNIYRKSHSPYIKYMLDHLNEFILLCRTCHIFLHMYYKYKEEIRDIKRLIK